VVISVGYRVKSQAGIQFRIWATDTLKKYMLKGYAINEKLLAAERERFDDLKKTISFISSKTRMDVLSGCEKDPLFIIDGYAGALSTLFQYDENRLEMPPGTKPVFELTYGECVEIIAGAKTVLSKRGEAGGLFGLDNKKRLEGIIRSVYQTFQGVDLYKTAEEKAAHILYLVIKDRPFADGNKRLASLFFMHFLNKNRLLEGGKNKRGINESALTALALLVAASNPKEKDLMIRLIMHLI
jgi:prophage maintenance system killer protein